MDTEHIKNELRQAARELKGRLGRPDRTSVKMDSRGGIITQLMWNGLYDKEEVRGRLWAVGDTFEVIIARSGWEAMSYNTKTHKHGTTITVVLRPKTIDAKEMMKRIGKYYK
jgi:hypothetical protein